MNVLILIILPAGIIVGIHQNVEHGGEGGGEGVYFVFSLLLE